jgi:hypothetical protein
MTKPLDGAVGDYRVHPDCVEMIVPHVGYLRIPTTPEAAARRGNPAVFWTLTIEDDGTPTLEPSISTRSRDKTGDVRWHGWLRRGELVDAGDSPPR